MEYFKELFNDDGREAELDAVQMNGRNRNARMIMELKEDVTKVMKKLMGCR